MEFRYLYNYSFILIPIVIWSVGGYCIDSKNGYCFFPGYRYKSRFLQCNITDGDDVKNDEESRKKDLKLIRDWAVSRLPDRNKSTHWWVSDLGTKEQNAFQRCVESSVIDRMFRSSFNERHYVVEPCHGMNEVYVTGPERTDETFNSDQIFYTEHVDGPFGLMPFVSVYRCIVGMDKNYATTTHFPVVCASKNACEGDVLAFDFNREVHYITRDASKLPISDEFRVVLKLHYCMYPKILAPLGWYMNRLVTNYDIAFRTLFLKTINPQTLFEHFMAYQVILVTFIFNTVENYIGAKNLIFLALVAMIWKITGCYAIFLGATSFMHYLRYISTFYSRKDIDFGSFKRDVFMFKILAIIQLGLFYWYPGYMSGNESLSFSVDYISLGMITLGWFTSTKATQALGLDRTYFGAELGICESKWVTEFPYGYIPHPMIVAQIFAYMGFYRAEHFRLATPWWLVPTHIALYVIHMTQEIFEIHAGWTPAPRPKFNKDENEDDGGGVDVERFIYNKSKERRRTELSETPTKGKQRARSQPRKKN